MLQLRYGLQTEAYGQVTNSSQILFMILYVIFKCKPLALLEKHMFVSTVCALL